MQARFSHSTILKTLVMASMLFVSQAYAAGPTGTKSDYGNISAPESANQVIVITAETKHVDVHNGDTVEFIAGDKKFTWHFDTFRQSSVFDLSNIAPKEFPAVGIKVYSQPDPTYMD